MVVPGECAVMVQPGDTLTSIARDNETTVDELYELNPDVNPGLIRQGDEIVVPCTSADAQTIAFNASITAVDLNYSGQLLAWTTNDGRAMVYQKGEDKTWTQLQQIILQTAPLNTLDFHPTTGHLAVAGENGTIYRVEPVTGAQFDTHREDNFTVNQLAYSPDGDWLAWGGGSDSDPQMRVWAAGRGEDPQPVNGLVVAPDDLALYPAPSDEEPGRNQVVVAIGAKNPSGSSIMQARSDTHFVFSSTNISGSAADTSHLAMTRDRRLAVSFDNRLQLRHLTGPNAEYELSFDAPINDLAFSTDDSVLAVATGRNVVLLAVKNGDELLTLTHPGSAAVVQALAFSGDGNWLATADHYEDGDRLLSKVLVWDLRGRQ
jgi:WD40 repeat protein